MHSMPNFAVLERESRHESSMGHQMYFYYLEWYLYVTKTMLVIYK